jgi:tetratricopeptide (TPR) repeat protein
MREQVISAEQMKEWALKAGEYFEAQPTLDDAILAKDYFEIAEAWQAFAGTSFNLQNHYQLIGLYPQAFELNQAVLEKNVAEKSISISAKDFAPGFYLFKTGQTSRRFLKVSH